MAAIAGGSGARVRRRRLAACAVSAVMAAVLRERNHRLDTATDRVAATLTEAQENKGKAKGRR